MKTPYLRFTLLAFAAARVLHAGPWEPMFNGKDLTGWKQLNGTAPYVVVDGAIVGTAVAASKANSFLATDRDFGDFILEMEIRQEGLSNGGIQFRSGSKPEFSDGRVHGYQYEIDPSDRAWTGGIYDEARRGWLYPGTLNPAGQKLYKYGEWNRVRIEAIGDSLRTFLNGQPVAHVIDNVTPRGFIALQVHALQNPGQAGFKTSWRNIRIQTKDLAPSPAASIYIRNMIPNGLSATQQAQGWQLAWDGKTTKGWRGAFKKIFPDKGWAIVNGEFQLPEAGGKEGFGGGDIVTEKQYSAFEFELEFMVPEGGNSGIKYFVREELAPVGGGNSAIGLEYQVSGNEPAPDSKKGLDTHSLGSLYELFTRAKMPGGLAIVPRVNEWQHARIVVRPDNHVEHWLNGIKALEYVRGSAQFKELVAKSKFKDIPNFGEAEKGNLLLQEHGHALRFRSIRIRELK
ncbi:MAG: DUF1080 domain-containing protein [Opitutus sp.]|nr:DUF1080 domain-containing protein [Opitutus sp.]